MPNQPLDEREFELVNIIGAKLASNQRDLSKHMDLSLGQTNMLIRRLVSKGYIRITQLNKRKVKYLLTPKGIAEKMRKSVKYMVKTINSIGFIRESLKTALADVVKKGERKFVILGESDFAVIVEMVLRDLCKDGYSIRHVIDMPSERIEGVLLICREGFSADDSPNKDNSINLIEGLAKDDVVLNGIL